jgi:hypothetical protein
MLTTVRFLIAIAALSFTGVANAAPVVLDFEDTPYEGTTFEDPFVTKGFVIDPSDPPSVSAISSGPDSHLVICGWCANGSEGVSIFADSGLRFELTSMEVSFVELPMTGIVVGHFANGDTLSESIVAGVMSFDSSWTKLASIDILFDTSVIAVPPYLAAEIDNIHVSEVPVPAAVWLFGSALGALGWRRRRRA